ncbi:MAG: 16S rRNA (adenine(1518)-N(6)/adenine(1519)-N(6))-dimethyltransferase RsmA [Deltaproteobacteria bacterium]|jgi:16S rRNA (adenine1518-N6/adenine1519-N6)-dimethyltransferase|nr:16S rRNA (adenine(1518)-N(6)/adenine(1519)-N(6))-dimethyltransferase RsmA [Deltaproteobacteria bacterium]
MTGPKERLRELGLAPLKGLGQNFLASPQLAEKIAKEVYRQGEKNIVVEIGPGLGALTFPLLDLGLTVYALEIDRGLAAELAKNNEATHRSLIILNTDALKVGLDTLPTGPKTICGNIPYNISSQVLMWFLSTFNGKSPGVFLLQKELVIRLLASPGSKDYGRITVPMKLFFELSSPFTIAPDAFRPRPKVESALLVLKPVLDPPKVDIQKLSAMTKICFHARRKTLYNNLISAFAPQEVKKALSQLGLDPGLRPETLAPESFAKLAAFFWEDAPS